MLIMAESDLAPEEYRRRWGIETGYRMQDNALAKAMSTDYKLRLL